LLWALDQLTDTNVQREYYITDCPAILMAAGKKVTAEKVLQPCESLSINSMGELALVEEEMKQRGNDELPMSNEIVILRGQQ
jgi:bifunctional N-acetylglucosamine-1-phosphate-uridyltransferase/glucosamine-1-phosphate-acetyltransferase GlmU-like protein